METVAQIPKYNLNEEQERKLILREYRSLLRSLKAKIKPGDKELVRTAFEMAADAHKTMRRKSGEPYILHPLAVAKICVEEIGLGCSFHYLFACCMIRLKIPMFPWKMLKENLGRRLPGSLMVLPKSPMSLMSMLRNRQRILKRYC